MVFFLLCDILIELCCRPSVRVIIAIKLVTFGSERAIGICKTPVLQACEVDAEFGAEYITWPTEGR